MKLLILFLVGQAAVAQVHINCGGSASGIYAADNSFVDDGKNFAYQQSRPLLPGTPPYLSTVRGADLTAGGKFSYNFPLPDGAYTVTLHFSESSTAVTAAGQRVFSVSMNGAAIIPSIDLASLAPLGTPIDRTFPVTTVGGSGVQLTFSTIVRNAVVSAIDIVPVPDRSPDGILVVTTSPGVPAASACGGPMTSMPGLFIDYDLAEKQLYLCDTVWVQIGLTFPGVTSDGIGGLLVQGSITTGSGSNFDSAITLNGITYLWPKDDGTGKTIGDLGVRPCGNLDPKFLATNPVCHQLAWR